MDKILLRQLGIDEGRKKAPYKDTKGIWTGGIGHNFEAHGEAPRGLTDQEIDDYFAKDIQDSYDALDKNLPWWKTLNEPRQRVLVNMTFNMGIHSVLGFVNTIKLIKEGNYAQAALNMLKSKWARDVGARASRLSEQMRTGKDAY